jgi:hypothetical protein
MAIYWNWNTKDQIWEPSNQYAGAVVGQGYHLNFDNITVKNCTIYGVNKVGGIIGFASENEVNITNCKVVDCKLYGVTDDGGSVGGILGSNSGKATIKDCSVENTFISAPEGIAEVKRANGYIVGTSLAETTVTGCTFDENVALNSNYTLNKTIGAQRGSGFSVTIDNEAANWSTTSLTSIYNTDKPEYPAKPTENPQ